MPGTKRKRSSKYKGRASKKARKRTRRWPKGGEGSNANPSAGLRSSYTGLSTRRVGTMLPDRMFVKLQMQYDVTIVSTSGAYTSWIQAINSLYDPMGASGAAQPYMHQQWLALYERYRVHGMSYDVQVHMEATGLVSSSARAVVIIPTTSSSAFAALVAREQPGAVNRKMTVNTSQAEFNGYISVPKVFGITKEQHRTDDKYQATTGADPSSLAYMHIGVYDPSVATTCNTACAVQVTFYAEYFQRAKPAVSSHA